MKLTRYQKTVMLILALTQFTVVLDFMIMAPLGEQLIKDLHLTTTQFGTVVSVYAISAAISSFLSAAFADRFDRKRLLLFFYTGFILGTLFCGLAAAYETMLAARIFTGIFGGVLSSVALAIVADCFEPHLRGRVMGTIQMGFSVSQVIGIPAGLWIAHQWNWHVTFYGVACLTVFVWMGILFFLKPINQHVQASVSQNPLRHLVLTLTNRDHQKGFLAVSVLSLGGFLIMPFTTTFLVNNVHITQAQLPLIFMITGLSSMVVLPLIGRLSDRFNRMRIFIVGSIIAMLMVSLYTRMQPLPYQWVMLINVILFAGIMSRMVPAMALNAQLPQAQYRGAFMSINSSIQQLSGGIASFLAGHIVVQKTPTAPLLHFERLGYIMVILMLICLVLVYRVYTCVNKLNLK